MSRLIMTQRCLTGVALMRISLGLWALYFFLLHWAYRGFLWGPSAVLDHEKYVEVRRSFGLFQLSGSPLYYEILYVLALLIAILVVLGYKTRLIIPLHWLMIWSFQERNYLIGDGGDNIMRIVLLFLALTDCGARLSLDALRRRPPHPALAVLHNAGVLFIITQLCLTYMSTGLYKAMGELWQNGTALYYILRVDDFSWPGVAEAIYRSPLLVVLGTYGTVLFELVFAPALLNRWTRYLMLCVGIVFHVGIALVMGLVTFGWSMLSIYPLLLSDDEYSGLVARIAALRERVKLTVFYDGWCSFCRRNVRCLRAADVFGLVRYVSFREGGAPPGAEGRLQATSVSGKSEGIDAYVQIAARCPPLWPLVPALLLVRAVLGQKAYDMVAARRFMLSQCGEECRMGEP